MIKTNVKQNMLHITMNSEV